MTFATVYDENKNKWARDDCQSARYAYRQMYNIPRCSIEKMDEMTEYEFEYELILKAEYVDFMKHLSDEDPVDIEYDMENLRGGLRKEVRMDPTLYEEIKRRAEAGEYIEFGPLPEDGLKLSQKLAGVKMRVPKESSNAGEPVTAADAEEFESVDPAQLFGGEKRGGS